MMSKHLYWIVPLAFLSLVVYPYSYFALGKNTAAFAFWGRSATVRKAYRREFPFHPWMYIPAAAGEFVLRGGRCPVEICRKQDAFGDSICRFSPLW